MATRKYEQRLRAESAEETRRRIVDAVYERLRGAPTEPVSLDLVARKAGVARSTVYAIFGSRAGLFDALAEDLWERSGRDRLLRAVRHPDVRVTLREGLRETARMNAAYRDVYRALFSMAQLDADAVGDTVRRMEEERATGMARLARRLAREDLLRPEVTATTAAHLLWVLTSFDAFDLLYSGRGLDVEAVADLFVGTAERTLLR